MLNQPKKKRFYYDITIRNFFDTNPSKSPIEASFSETREQALFNDAPKKYNLSVVRFTVPTVEIPIQIVPIKYDVLNPTNINKTYLSICFKYLGIVYTQSIEWTTQAGFADTAFIPPPLPNGSYPPNFIKNKNFYAYYGLFSLNHFCTLINTALNVCFQTNIVPLLPVNPNGYVSPYFIYTPETRLFTVYTPFEFLQSNPNPIYLALNSELSNMFLASFDGIGFGYNNINGYDYQLTILDRRNNEYTLPIVPPVPLWGTIQEYDTTGYISQFSKILITSGSLCVVNDAVSSNQQDNTINSSQSAVGRGFIPLITDFEIDNASKKNVEGFIHYLPTAEYRRVAMLGDTPIKQTDISIFWEDVFGHIYPVVIPFNSFASIKILFEEA